MIGRVLIGEIARHDADLAHAMPTFRGNRIVEEALRL